ncbi:DUF1656 domain-containing protein [Alloalcanivorax xenomutans]|jgi:protein AaeX|uniref:DUF1656 domain-containing protein n=1 Tax=Alloalcanivorax xenomutans TaxID=1094342 RepID=A0A9Q3ZFW5_9GAMM|nr:DUF1656 domain-containing protein [Alloalcanivorax xenomutans]ERS13977.1 hypothetical protein Q668_11565 [Alcanivorax sp. PN-3]KYZ87880.1 hypothetical protein A3Q32_00150 [Alcanivorax sp. KX64203]MBA4721045.1 DUF1656 domain-containing protein [Alcanivorax sp.]ARB45952.1 hypothetical protein P40_11480 [Alloalcanivorax xenomutans]MCE7508604.1 DUF1656 domain-containing protein [Alloalcanivorax xenomutans]|tara:strand:+ start:433 stop:651 length:219 start_codon:yes stop_codon:yes gene_type:complete
MLYEIELGGVLLPPLVPQVLLALLLFLLVHGLISRFDGYRHLWHPALAGFCVFLIVLALVMGAWLSLGSMHG